MLSGCEKDPSNWRAMAEFEVQKNKDHKRAKEFLLKGLKFCPKSSELYLELMRVELDSAFPKKRPLPTAPINNEETGNASSNTKKIKIEDTDKGRNKKKDIKNKNIGRGRNRKGIKNENTGKGRNKINKIKKEDPDRNNVKEELKEEENPVDKESLERVSNLYDEFRKDKEDIHFYIELLKIVELYEGTDQLMDKLLTNFKMDFTHTPLMWDTLARKELRGNSMEPFTALKAYENPKWPWQVTLGYRIKRCYDIYIVSVEVLYTSQEMWDHFLDCMLEIYGMPDVHPYTRTQCFKNACKLASLSHVLKEKYYTHWLKILIEDGLQGTNKPRREKLYRLIATLCLYIIDSEQLWQIRLKVAHSIPREDYATLTFNRGVECLEEKSVGLWEIECLHIQQTKPEKLRDFYLKAIERKDAVSNAMKLSCLKWFMTTFKSIKKTRIVYKSLLFRPPVCMELHKKMIAYELAQPQVSVADLRTVHEMATLQFGETDIHVWNDYMLFEKNQGDERKVRILYDQAVETLRPELVVDFEIQYEIHVNTVRIKIEPET